MDEKVCKLRKKASVQELFMKSLKFFGLMNLVVFSTANILKYAFGVDQVLVLFMIGNYCAIQATYYKFRMAADPTYKPDCHCYDDEGPSFTDDAMNGILTVLEHKKGTLLFNVPNSVFGISILFRPHVSHEFGIEHLAHKVPSHYKLSR